MALLSTQSRMPASASRRTTLVLLAMVACGLAVFRTQGRVQPQSHPTFPATTAPHTAAPFTKECQARVHASGATLPDAYACWCSCSAVSGHDMQDFRRRERSVCPDGSVERHRFLCHLLMTKAYTNISRALFISPDRSAFEFVISAFPGADVVGGYKHIEGSFVPKTKQPMLDIDLTAVPFPDNFFDLVMVQHVFEHIQEDGRAFGEVHRVLKPGGKGLFEVPITAPEQTIENVEGVNTRADRLRVYGQEDHIRRYANDFYDRVRAAGFEVDIIKYSDHFARHLPPSVTFHNAEITSDQTVCVATKLV